jgi:hemerythrin-like domain-containing protein
MTFGVEFLRERVLAVMREEERTVYPEVERAVGATLHGRACFRYGHRVAEQWVQELEELALGCHPDAAEFRARAQDLILFLREHFEFEDRVVLPVLERRPVGPDLGAGLLCEP